MTDKVPLNISGERGSLGCKLLRAALGKEPLTGVVRLLQSLDGAEF